MSSWVVPMEKSKYKVMYNVDEFRSINVLDSTFIRGSQKDHVVVGFPRLDLKDCQPVVLFGGTQKQCDEMFDKLMLDIENEVKVIHLLVEDGHDDRLDYTYMRDAR